MAQNIKEKPTTTIFC